MLQTDVLRTWLEDAYGAETALLDIMEKQLADLSGQHEMDEKVQQYLNRMQRHANMMQDCLAGLKGETSSLNKGGLPDALNSLKELWSKANSNVLVKHVIVDAAAVHYQIAQVKAVLMMARGIGAGDVATACQRMLDEKEEMAGWFAGYLPELVHQLTRTFAGAEDTADDARHKVDRAGTLLQQHLYAVFDDAEAARKVTELLRSDGVRAEWFADKAAAAALTEEASGPTRLVGKAIRSAKSGTGETQQAEHYATQVENGHIVLSIPCDDRASAERLLSMLKEQGGYDFAYYSASSIETIE